MTEIEAYPTVVEERRVVVSEENAEGMFREFIREHNNVFRVEADDLRLVSVRKINNRWYVKYEQKYKGLPVHNATVGLDSAEDSKVGTYAPATTLTLTCRSSRRSAWRPPPTPPSKPTQETATQSAAPGRRLAGLPREV